MHYDSTVLMFGSRVFCGTWNVGGQEPSCDLNDWLSAQDGDRLPDIYAIGLALAFRSHNVNE